MTYNLGFITDDDILAHVADTVQKYRCSFSMGLKEFNKNLIDPVKLTFDARIYHKDIAQVIEDEVLRQVDKSNTNHIGYFHQNIFKYCGGGWVVPTNGYDIVNEEQNIYVEMKNKHNTMNSSSSQKTYMRMQNTLLHHQDATCLLVEVIAKKSQDIIWKTRVDNNPVSHPNIRRVSIDKFYEIVTGDRLAFRKLCEKLPQIISDAVDVTQDNTVQNTVHAELLKLSPNLMKSIYLLSFAKYEGFNQLDMPQ